MFFVTSERGICRPATSGKLHRRTWLPRLIIGSSVNHFLISASSADSAVNRSYSVTGLDHWGRAVKESAVSLLGGAIACAEEVSARRWSNLREFRSGVCGTLVLGMAKAASDAIIAEDAAYDLCALVPPNSAAMTRGLGSKAPSAFQINCPASDRKQPTHNTAQASMQRLVTLIFLMSFSRRSTLEPHFEVDPGQSYISYTFNYQDIMHKISCK